MADFIFLVHDDVTRPTKGWDAYFAKLNGLGCFQGGSQIGAGTAFRKSGAPAPLSVDLTGYIRVKAVDLAAAAELLKGHPVYEAGGTVEIRRLPRS